MRPDQRNKRRLVLWATDCAEHVLPYFEERYPEDDRPRKAVEAARAWVRGEIAFKEVRAAALAAHAAARAAHAAAPRATARAAGHAAAAAHVAGHAAHAATYAAHAATQATTDAAYSATDAAVATNAAHAAAAKERAWQIRRLPKALRPVAFPSRSNR